jgi:hypothetical protein
MLAAATGKRPLDYGSAMPIENDHHAGGCVG